MTVEKPSNFYLIYTTDGTNLESVTIAYEEYISEDVLLHQVRTHRLTHGEMFQFIVIEGRQVMVNDKMTMLVRRN
jgi:hypothetical protein